MPGRSQKSTNRGDLDNSTTLPLWIYLSKDAKSFSGYVNWTPEIGFELAMGVRVGDGFHVSHQAVSGIIDHDVDLMESVQRFGERCGYFFLTCHI